MFELVSWFVMFFEGKVSACGKCVGLGLVVFAAFVGPVHGQDNRKVPISFLPPPLENATYSLGIYEAKSGKLVRRLQEIAPESAFTVGLNGLMTSWDGKDDAGKAVPPGRYAARGYAVGTIKVAGVGILGNDWASDDEGLRIYGVAAFALVPADNGLAIIGVTLPSKDASVARYGGAKHELIWQRPATALALPDWDSAFQYTLTAQGDLMLTTYVNKKAAYLIADGSEVTPTPVFPPRIAATESEGKDGTVWKIESGVLSQYSRQGEPMRSLIPKEGEPVPEAVSASKTADQLYLLEETETKDWERIRGLSWKESTHEGDKAVSKWETFFEHSIRPRFMPPGVLSEPVDCALVENPLTPGKKPHLKLDSAHDSAGSYLATAEGLHLRQISRRPFLAAARFAKGKTANVFAFYQSDGAACDEFSIEGARNIMEFDAGEFEMTAEGEKAHTEKPAEPPDL